MVRHGGGRRLVRPALIDQKFPVGTMLERGVGTGALQNRQGFSKQLHVISLEGSDAPKPAAKKSLLRLRQRRAQAGEGRDRLLGRTPASIVGRPVKPKKG